MKINITSSSDIFKNITIEGELLQVIDDLRKGKIDISSIIEKRCSWLYDEKTKTINNPKCFFIEYDCDDCDVEITLYDYYYD